MKDFTLISRPPMASLFNSNTPRPLSIWPKCGQLTTMIFLLSAFSLPVTAGSSASPVRGHSGFPLLFASSGSNSFASHEDEQRQTDISLTVLNKETKEPVAGALLTVAGTAASGASDENGRFSLNNIEDTGNLTITSVGLVSVSLSLQRLIQLPVGSIVAIQDATVHKSGPHSFVVELPPSVSRLDEVIVVGYGTVKKSDLTGSVASIRGEEIGAFPTANFMQALSGRASGVHVKQNTGAPGSPISVRVRGSNSLQGSNEPLYVVDGVPLNGAPLILNNADIGSVEILKDASAIAIYGSRGANGVVLITTNTGQLGKTSVDFETSYGVQQLRKKLELLNAREYAQFYNMQHENDGLQPFFTQDQINGFGTGFDWQDFVYQDAPIQNHSLNIRTGNERTTASISGSVFDQQGIIRGSSYARYSLTGNIQHNIGNKFKATLSTILSRTDEFRQNSAGGRFGNSLVSASLVTPPTLTPYNEDGSYRVLAKIYPFLSEGLTNPLNFINETTDRILRDQVLATATLSYEPVDGLVFKVLGGIENTNGRNDYYQTLKYFNSIGRANVSTSGFTSLLNENTVSYSKTFTSKHSVSAVAGFTYQDFLSNNLDASGTGFLSDATETHNLSSAAIPGIPATSYSKSVLLSYLTRINYSFDDRLLATFSFRSDGSSKYSVGDKWGYFPSAALAYRLRAISAWTSGVFSDMKVRASWGKAGSQAIGAYATLNQLIAGRVVLGDALYNTFAPGTRLPGALRWETTAQTNVGIDFSLLDYRVEVTADYYDKITSDLLNTVQLPSSLGFTSTIRNVGEIRNRGIELSASARISDGAFKWNLSGNISFNKSRVKKLYDGQQILDGRIDMLIFADDMTLLREGSPMGVFYGYVEDGYTDEGKIKYKDHNEDGTINILDKAIIGDPNPNFIYGVNSTMNYKNFELSVFLQGSQGNDLVNLSKVGNTLHYFWGTNMLKEVLNDHWTPENPHAKYPKISGNQSLRFSDRFVENGSYLKVRNIELSYNLPFTKWIAKWAGSGKIYVSAQNFFTITKYSWWDPEVNSRGGANSVTQGVDYSTYPNAKSITMGLRLGF